MPDLPVSLKQLVRDFMDRRTHSEDPPPSREEIRRQMGWDLIPENKLPDSQENEAP